VRLVDGLAVRVPRVRVLGIASHLPISTTGAHEPGQAATTRAARRWRTTPSSLEVPEVNNRATAVILGLLANASRRGLPCIAALYFPVPIREQSRSRDATPCRMACSRNRRWACRDIRAQSLRNDPRCPAGADRAVRSPRPPELGTARRYPHEACGARVGWMLWSRRGLVFVR
jgi:hypothetical protein